MNEQDIQGIENGCTMRRCRVSMKFDRDEKMFQEP
jgi:hypothetical protein